APHKPKNIFEYATERSYLHPTAYWRNWRSRDAKEARDTRHCYKHRGSAERHVGALKWRGLQKPKSWICRKRFSRKPFARTILLRTRETQKNRNSKETSHARNCRAGFFSSSPA